LGRATPEKAEYTGDFLEVRCQHETKTGCSVPDYLGHMWRKGQVLRLPAPKDDRTRARWMYVRKPQKPAPKPTAAEAVQQAEQLTVNKLLSRPLTSKSPKKATPS